MSADEINRASPRTQSALLEAMGENQVSVGGDRYALDDLFFVIATQSPIEFHGTHLLPEAQIDRFAMRFSLGYVRAMRPRLRLKRQGTDRSQALSPLIVFCAVLGLNTDKSLVYQPFAFLLYAILIYRFSLRFSKPNVSVNRKLPNYATAGQPFEYQIVVYNTGNRTEANFRLVDIPFVQPPTRQQFRTESEPGEESRNAYEQFFA